MKIPYRENVSVLHEDEWSYFTVLIDSVVCRNLFKNKDHLIEIKLFFLWNNSMLWQL